MAWKNKEEEHREVTSHATSQAIGVAESIQPRRSRRPGNGRQGGREWMSQT